MKRCLHLMLLTALFLSMATPGASLAGPAPPSSLYNSQSAQGETSPPFSSPQLFAPHTLLPVSPRSASEPQTAPDPTPEPAATSEQAVSPTWIEPLRLPSAPGFSLPQSSGVPAGPATSVSPDSIQSAPGDWDNGWALACITPLGIALNAALGASLAASPPLDFFAQGAEYIANLGLKACAPAIYPPSDFQVSNVKAAGTCGFTFDQNRTQGQYQNFYGITLPWGDVFPGKQWGDFGEPLVIHWNTDVDVVLNSPGWTRLQNASGNLTDRYWMPTGVHSLTWTGYTRIGLLDPLLIYIPGAAWAKLSKMRKLEKYVKDVQKFADNVKDAADYGILGLDLLLGQVLPSWRTGMFNEETQYVAVTDTVPPALTAKHGGVIPVEAIQPGGVSKNTYLYLLQRELLVSDDCDASPSVEATNWSSLPDFAPVGSSYQVNWVAKDNGPLDLNGGVNSSAPVDMSFVVQDTLPPILLAPPDVVTETASLPAQIEMGFPATFDLADLNPTVSQDACTRPGVTCDPNGVPSFPAGKTTVTWTATDASGNTATAAQLINVKSVGSNHTPTANPVTGGSAPQAISYEPITVTLTAQDPDADPLWFKITQQPGNGFFHSPLYPYFIQDYRLANFQNISFRDYCAQLGHSGYVPTNWPVSADFMAVADDGTVYVHDHGMVFCGGTGDVHEDYRLAIFRPDGTWDQIADSFDTKDIYVDFRNNFIYTVRTNIGGDSFFKVLDLQLNLIEQYRLDNADVLLNQPRVGVMDDQGLIYASNGFEYSGSAQLYIYDTTQGPHPVQVADYTLSDRVFVDLVLDSQNNLYASERNMSRVYKFSPMMRNPDGSLTTGQLIGWMGKCDAGPGCDIANGRSFGFSCTEATCTLNSGSSPSGSLPGQFDSPRGMALDLNDILYVTDYNNLRVQRFTPQGYYAGQAVSQCDGSCFVLGDFGHPKQVTVNSSHFYILDDNNDLLHVFETTPLTRLDGDTAQIVYQSRNNFVGTDSFSFTASDGLATSAPAAVEIQVSRNYRPPVADPPQAATSIEDTPISLHFSGYDPDEPLDTLSFQAGALPQHGALSGSGADLLYTPAQDFAGTDTFTIVANDGVFLSEAQPMTVTLTPVNDVPSFPEDANQPAGIAYRLGGQTLSLSRFVPLGSAAAPIQIGRGFSTLFSVTYYDPDDLDTHTVNIDWGDGSPVEPEGKLLEDGSMTGPVLTEGQTGGLGSIAARHIFDQTGSFDISVCVTDNMQVDADGNKTPTPQSTTACKSIPVQVSNMTDLILQVTPSYNPLPVDRDLTLQIDLTNNPPDSGTGLTATGISLTDTLDARMLYQSATSSVGSCTRQGRKITCPVGTLAPGETATIELTVSLAPGLSPGEVISNLAAYTLDQADQSDVKADLQLLTLVQPADYVVNTIADDPDANPSDGICASSQGECSLRAAVEQANAAAGAQTIALADWQVLLSSELAVNDDLTLTGLGAGKTVLGGSAGTRLLSVSAGNSLSLKDLTLQGGASDADGGGLYVSSGASASLEGVQLSGNHADANGGAIYNGGNLTIQDSAITGNDATSGAGGIHNDGTLNLQNVTISANQGGLGAGIASTGSATLVNVSVAYNHTTGSGGGLNGGPNNFSLRSSILWGNTAQVAGPDCGYGFTSQGYNLLGDLQDCTVTGDTSTNLVGQDPHLQPPEFNGALTLSQALRSDSPAIDAGACDLPADQRGVLRPQDGNLDGSPACDIGAYEFTPTILFLPVLVNTGQ